MDVMQEVRSHLATLLHDRGLGTSPMFTIPETTLEDGFLPVGLVAPLAGWLRRLALDARSRDVVVRRTLIGILDSLDQRVRVVAAAADAQAAAETQLRRDVESRYDAAQEELRRSVVDGGVVRGEVLARWNEFVATGDVFRSLEPGGTTWRDRLRVRIRAPRVAPAQPLLDSVHHGLEDVVLARLRAASEALVAAWGERTAGRGLLEARPDIAALPPGFGDRLGRTLRDWRSTLTELVQERPAGVRGQGVALGIDGAVAVLAVLTLSPPPSGREPGDAASAAAAVLAASHGADAVEPLAGAARADLGRRTGELLESERERVLGVLDALGIRPGRGDVLLARAAVVEEAR
jgi:hypothetical protein